MKRRFKCLVLAVFVVHFSAYGIENNYFDTFAYSCGNVKQPSSAPFLAHFAPHLLTHAVDIDFVVKQTGVCTSLLLALIEQESALVRRHTTRRKPWVRPFGDLSKKYGFIAQLVDVARKLRQLKNKSYSGYLPLDEKMAYLFDANALKSTMTLSFHSESRTRFQTLYRDMFMLEYKPMRYLHSSDFGLKQDLLLRSWQFHQNLERSLFTIT